MVSLNDRDRRCKDWKCNGKKCPYPCRGCSGGKCEQCRYGYMNAVNRIKLKVDNLEEYSYCEYVQLILKEKENKSMELKEKEVLKEERQDDTNELGLELKKYRKKLEIKALQSFFDVMLRRDIDLFKYDKLVVTCIIDGWGRGIKIETFKREKQTRELELYFHEDSELIQILYDYKEVIEKGLGAKIDFKEERNKETIYTWEIDCTGIK